MKPYPIEARCTAESLRRQPTSPPRDSSTIALPREPSKSHQASEPNTHTTWDNLGCLAPRPTTEVSGFRLVDWLDKDT
jgi:hypothetical protein